MSLHRDREGGKCTYCIESRQHPGQDSASDQIRSDEAIRSIRIVLIVKSTLPWLEAFGCLVVFLTSSMFIMR